MMRTLEGSISMVQMTISGFLLIPLNIISGEIVDCILLKVIK